MVHLVFAKTVPINTEITKTDPKFPKLAYKAKRGVFSPKLEGRDGEGSQECPGLLEWEWSEGLDVGFLFETTHTHTHTCSEISTQGEGKGRRRGEDAHLCWKKRGGRAAAPEQDVGGGVGVIFKIENKEREGEN